ncbi:MAG TPA: polyketide antibiotic transporter [Pseudonocardia sp.]|nr:polyketide antibiotic transporter [Pseudonocardia sp.]
MNAVTSLALRQVRRGALIVLLVAAGMSALVAVQYRTTFAGALDGAALQALAANPAIRTLFGTPVALDDPGGFTVWRTGTPVTVVVGAWALLAATRITRGEEDAGRWGVLLAGRIRLPELVARHLAVLIGAVLVIGAGTAAALVVAGTAVSGALLHGAGVALVGAGFAALGTLAAQVLPARAAAAGAAVAVLGATLLARMLADGIGALAWLRWASPFGVLAQVQPYAANRPGPLLVAALVAVAAAAGALVAAGRRDLGAGLVQVRSARRPRLRLLRSVRGFAVRRALRPLAGWALGLGAYFLLVGLLTVSVTGFLAENARFAELAAGAGFGGLGSVPGFAAALFGLLAIPVGIFAAARIAALAEDETSRRGVLLAALPVSRTRLLGVEIAVTAAGVGVLVGVAAAAMWAGSAMVGAGLGLAAALAGALNVAPVALLCLAAAVLALGVAPRAVLAVGAVPAAGGFLLQVVAQSTGAPAAVAWLSPFSHVAAVPEVAPDGAGAVGMLAVAVAAALTGVATYARRDLAL